LLVCLAAPGSAQVKNIRVAAASDLQVVMPQIAKAFEEQTQVRVELVYGSSGNFFAQIQNGAPFDLFFSADSEFPERLIQAGSADGRSAAVYAVGGLVLWMPANASCNLQTEKWNCLLQPAVNKIAIANPAHAPYGRAAVAALQKAGIYEQVRAKLVYGENISQAAQFVQSGNAQAGIVALSLAVSPAMKDGKRWEIPADTYPRIEQGAIVLKSARNKEAARAFMAFVKSNVGRAIFERYGFELPGATAVNSRTK